MAITYNCALDIYSNLNDVQSSINLFAEIEKLFKADLVTYSTMVKTLCNNDKKDLAFQYIKQMLNRKVVEDTSIVNLFLEQCSNKIDFSMGIQAFQHSIS